MVARQDVRKPRFLLRVGAILRRGTPTRKAITRGPSSRKDSFIGLSSLACHHWSVITPSRAVTRPHHARRGCGCRARVGSAAGVVARDLHLLLEVHTAPAIADLPCAHATSPPACGSRGGGAQREAPRPPDPAQLRV